MAYSDSRTVSYTLNKAAYLVDVSPDLLLHEIRENRIKARYKDGIERQYYIRKIHLEKWMEKNLIEFHKRVL